MKTKATVLGAALCLLAISASAAVFVVDSVGDEPDADISDGICRTTLGTCTLRAAIEQANALAGADVIKFNIPGPGVHTIAPATLLPSLTDDAGVTIDGYTQPGASPNTLAVGDDAVLLIEVDGSASGQFGRGLQVVGSGAVLSGLIVNSVDGFGVDIQGGIGHFIRGCFVGTDASGTTAKPNRTGIVVNPTESGAASTDHGSSSLPYVATIGGSAPAHRNLVSGNLTGGIALTFLSRAIVQGNLVGTDASGSLALGNSGAGVDLVATDCVVGGLGPGEGNVISGNLSGVILRSGGGNAIIGNRIGTDATGTVSLPNGSGIQLVQEVGTHIQVNVISGNSLHGVRIFSGAGILVDRNVIGSPAMGNGGHGILIVGDAVKASATGNTIAFNGGNGIQVGASPTDRTNDNSFYLNSIHDNGGLGIDLGGDGVSSNNDCDPGRGPNLGQNFPIIVLATPVPGGTRIEGTLNSVPGLAYQIEFFSNPFCDPSGYGEGETRIGSFSVTTDQSCDAAFDVVLPVFVPAGSVVTATATDPTGNTSEFSKCQPVVTGQDFYTITPCRVADTRGPTGPYGGPPLAPATDRAFVVTGQCGIPVDARAVAFNFTATQPTSSGDIRVFPSGTLLPLSSVVNYSAGQTRAASAVFALGANGGINTHVDQTSGTVHLVIDATGYFR